MGRATECTPELIERARGYLATCVDDFSDKDCRSVRLPSIAGLAVYLGYSRDAVHDWRHKNIDFAYILDEILAEQEHRLLNNGLAGTFNANIAKLALGKHGYHDTSAIDHTSKGESLAKYAQLSDEAKKKMELLYEEDLRNKVIQIEKT